MKNGGYCNDVITDKEFCGMAKEASKDFFKMFNYIQNRKDFRSRKFYSALIRTAETFESFLDEHGARRNKNWVLLSEAVASIRNIAIAAFHLSHLLNRYQFYKLDEIQLEREEFHNEAYLTMQFFDKAINTLFHSTKEEVIRNGVDVTEEFFTNDDMKDIFINRQLERNADEEEVVNGEEKIVELCRRYRKAAKLARDEDIDRKFSAEEVVKIIPLKISENKMQKLKNIIHGVQSDYDTYVRSTKIEMDNSNFIKFRGYVSIPLHMMMVLIMLSHFYERHENEIRHGETKEKIAKLVDKNTVLDRAVNFAFYYCNNYLQKGNALAETLLYSYIIKVRYELPIPHPLGFHARPSTYISLIVNEHGTDVFLIVEDKKYNAKSVLNLMEAGGLISEKGMTKVIFEGDKRVLDDLKILADHNYCEDGNIPKDLNYIRILRNVG